MAHELSVSSRALGETFFFGLLQGLASFGDAARYRGLCRSAASGGRAARGCLYGVSPARCPISCSSGLAQRSSAPASFDWTAAPASRWIADAG